MKNSILISFLWLVLCLVPSFADDLDQAAFRSEFWPEKVQTKVPLTGKMHGNRIKEGSSAVLLRFEDGKVVADFGHGGIFHLKPGETDFPERVEANSDHLFFGNDVGTFAFRYAKFFFWVESNQACSIEDFTDKNYFLLFFFAGDPERVLPLLRYLNEGLSESEDLQLLAIPLSDEVDPYSPHEEAVVVDYPVIIPFLREAFLHTEGYDFEGTATICLLDRFGKRVETFEVGEKEPETLLEEIVLAYMKDRESRK